MTTIEALTNSVNYPLNEASVESILIKRGLNTTDEFTSELANSKEYELAYADVLRYVVTMVNLSQGGSVSQASVAELRGTANAIYKKYGELTIGVVGDDSPTVKIIENEYVNI